MTCHNYALLHPSSVPPTDLATPHHSTRKNCNATRDAPRAMRHTRCATRNTLCYFVTAGAPHRLGSGKGIDEFLYVTSWSGRWPVSRWKNVGTDRSRRSPRTSGAPRHRGCCPSTPREAARYGPGRLGPGEAAKKKTKGSRSGQMDGSSEGSFPPRPT